MRDRRQRVCAPRRPRAGHGPPASRSTARRSPSCASATTSTPSATPAATPTSRSPRARCSCDEREIECWKHGSTFSLVTGEPQTLPATQPVPVYDVAVRRRRRDRGGSVARDHARDPRAAGRRRRQGDPARHRPHRVARARCTPSWGRTAPASRTLSAVVMGKPGYEVLGGSVTLDGVDVLALAAWERAAAGLLPRDAVPDRGARRRASTTCWPRRSAARGRPTDDLDARLRGRGGADRLRRAVPRPAAQRRPVRRREEAQRDAAARRAGAARSPSSTSSTRASTSTPCGPAPAGSRRSPTTTGLGVLAITHYNRLLHELQPDHVHILVKGRIVATRRPRAGRRARARRLRRLRRRRARACASPWRRSRPADPFADPFADPLA